MKKSLIYLLILLIFVIGSFLYYKYQTNLINIDFDSCVKAGGIKDHDEGTLASFCRINGQNYYFELPEGTVN